MTYPATNSKEASELLIDVSNQMHEIVNEDATTEVMTESGLVPSVRKALADTFLFQDPIPWSQGSDETAFNQLRTFDDNIYWAPTATLSTPIPMGATPIGDSNWKLAPVDVSREWTLQELTRSQNEVIGGKIFPLDDSVLQNGDNVPVGTTHLRVDIGGEPTIVAMSPVSSGLVSALTESTVTIGGVAVTFKRYAPLTSEIKSMSGLGGYIYTSGYHESGVGRIELVYDSVNPAKAGANPEFVSGVFTVYDSVGTIYKHINNQPTTRKRCDITQFGCAPDATPSATGVAPSDGTDWSSLVNEILLNFDHVHVPAPNNGKVYKASNLQLRKDHVITGDGKDIHALSGNAGEPIWLTNPDGTTTTVRGVEMRDLYSWADGAPAMQAYGCPDHNFQRCSFYAYRSPAFDADTSVRGKLNHSKIVSSSGGLSNIYALTGIELNGSDYSHNTYSGGQGGGAYDIGRTQDLDLSFGIIEISGLVACRVARNHGNCSAINMRNTYFEQVYGTFEIGTSFTAFSCDISYSRCGNDVTSIISGRTQAIRLGRVIGLKGLSLDYLGSNSAGEYLIGFSDVTSGLGPFPFPYDCEITFSRNEGYLGYFDYFSFPVVGRKADIFGNNKIKFFDSEVYGQEGEVLISGITANASKTVRVVPISQGGGRIKSAEILNKEGDCTCTLRFGYDLNLSENLTVDPETLTYDFGYANLTVSNSSIRPDKGILLSIVSPSGAGSFDVKVTYITG